MYELIDILRFSTIFLQIVIIILFLKSKSRFQERGIAVFFILGVLSYLIADWDPLTEYPVLLVTAIICNFTITYSFWLFSKSLFDDKFQLKKNHLWGLLIVVLIEAILAFGLKNWVPSDSPGYIFVDLLLHGISITFVILGIVEAARNKEADLILSRHRFRSLFILFTALIMISTIMTELAFGRNDFPLVLEFIQKAFIALLTFYFAIQRLEFKTGFFNEIIEEEAIPEKAEPMIDKKLVRQLLHQMDIDKVYKTEGLTIRALAVKLEVKEYKLRQTINQQLGFRNFNDFLNSYRIQEACEILSDIQQKELTVLEIAFDLGYNSLAPFNRAFKEETGKTPTEWRKEKKA